MAAFAPLNCSELFEPVKSALEAWRSSTSDDALGDLLIVRQQRREMGIEHQPTRWRLATNTILGNAIDILERENQDWAQVLRLRYLQKDTISMVAIKMNTAEITVSRHQKDGVGRVADILCDQEKEARQQLAVAVESRLPARTYSKLFGVDQLHQQLVQQIVSTQPPWVVAIIGLGGIGKTSLADSVVRSVVSGFHFEDIVWLRAEASSLSGRSKQPEMTFETLITDLAEHFWPGRSDAQFPQRLVQVRQKLKERPYLIVIDNLERQSDTAYLLDQLHELTDPSRFLLTSRSWPFVQARVFSLSLDELAYEDAIELIKYHGQERGILWINGAAETDFWSIYRCVGGNPQALKLTTSLLDVLPLSDLLANLQYGRSGDGIEKMYRHIYWKSWQTLTRDARRLLQQMPLVAERGGDPEYLQAVSGLSSNSFWPALQELRSRSLVEVRGNIHDKRYGVHRLTETFLRTEIINWEERPDDE